MLAAVAIVLIEYIDYLSDSSHFACGQLAVAYEIFSMVQIAPMYLSEGMVTHG